MITQSYKKWLLPFIFLAILYACTSEYGEQPDDAKKQIEPLTVATAQSLYEQYVGLSQLKNMSDDSGSGIELIPDWSRGLLSSDSNWYVVESPLEFGVDRQFRLIAPGVEEYAQIHTDPSDIKQHQRLVMLRNKESGKTYAFVMLIVPELEYMLQKGSRLAENQYLYRDPELDGMVMFYTTDGQFVNGWKYEKGKINSALYTNSRSGRFTTKVDDTKKNCYGTIDYERDEFGNWIGVAGIVCSRSNNNYDRDQHDLVEGNFWIEQTDPIDESNPGSPTPPPPDDKKPETRTDCSGSATQNASNAQNAMKVPDLLANLNFLREYAKGKENEWGLLINSYYGSYTASELKEGKTGSVSIAVNSNTVYDVHTHTDDKREGYNVYTGFSVGDIYGMFDASYHYPNYKGSIVISYDGNEYLLAIDDRNKLLQFWGVNANKELFKSGDNTIFKDKDTYDDYENIRKSLDKQGYSADDAHDYALSYLLDKHNTGLKISKKEKGESSFKETKTKKDASNVYKPTKCP